MAMQPRKPVADFFTFILGAVLLSTGVFLFFNQVLVGCHGFGMAGRFGLRRGWGGGMFGHGRGGVAGVAAGAAVARWPPAVLSVCC
ncbi:MAG: hypothetical protein WAM11_07170 [Cyanobium sp.]